MDREDLSKFTDILDEICDSQPLEIYDSQPLSLASSNITQVSQESPIPKSTRPPKCTGQMGNFRSVEEIDPKYQHIFTYRYFNLVQSNVIEDALYSDKSLVVCAPTGSGKTVIFEMAIVQLLMELEDKNYKSDFKIIYMAPVKALCTERITEWHSKFTQLGLLCIEVTGDTDIDFPQLKPYSIIITTPEKWDMLTRRWKDHRGLVEVVKLFLIDEVHILNDEIRGPVLEAVVSRMKTIQSSVQSVHRVEQLKAQFQGADSRQEPPRIRFVAVSATVSNPEDVAVWLGNGEQIAACYRFGDECRPVKLKRVVEGYSCPVGTSIFKFDIMLNYKLWPIIQKYYNGKPTLIFCNTRKGVVLTAETLSREITMNFNEALKSRLIALASILKDKKVQSLILCGVGYHHAGLLYEERRNIEQAFRNRDLPILVTTTTLAMGVNLPAHLVIIKNTQQYVNGAYQEYSISTVLQMVGRAGRPQYDTEATAVIMTRLQDKARYQTLVEGCEPLQSYLHKRLAENLNSEAALGTVCDVAQCVQWVNSTFLKVRAAREPKRYLNITSAAPAELITKKIEELCVRAMNGLASAGLITMDEASCIESTEAGQLMSLYYIDLETMKLIMKLEGTECLERLLWLLCECHELSDMHLRVDERRCLNALNRNRVAATIRFPMKGKINSRQMKLSCVIQAVLGCLPIAEPSLNQEAMKIMKIAIRVCKCLVSYVTRYNFITENPKFYTTILNSLILAKCISAQLWENSPYVSRQLKGIGAAYSTLLASAGKTNFLVLEESHPRDLERIMNKGPPAGNILRKQISLLPKYSLSMTSVNENTVRVQLTLLNHAHLAENMDNLTAGVDHKSYVIVGDSENYILYFTCFKESNLITVYDGCMTFDVTRKHNNEHKVIAHCISSTFVGIDEKCEFVFVDLNSLNIANEQFPVTQTLDTQCLIKQPKITDLFKERKRKCLDKEDIPSKEKRKRDNIFMDKLKTMKKSLEKSEITKQDHDKTPDVFLNLVPDLTYTTPEILGNHLNIDNQYEIQHLDEALSDNFDLNDIDDDQIKNISSDRRAGKSSDSITLEVESLPSEKNRFSYFQKNIPYKYNNRHDLRFCKKINTKNNFAFLDKLEKKDKDEIDEGDKRLETDFSKIVKPKMEKYFQETRNKYKMNSSFINILDSSNLIDEDTGVKNIKNVVEIYSNDKSEDLIRSYNNKSKCTENKDQLTETSESSNSLINMALTNVSYSATKLVPNQSNLNIIPYSDEINENSRLKELSVKNIILENADKHKKEISGNSVTLFPDYPFEPFSITPNNEAQLFRIKPQTSQNFFFEKTNNCPKNSNNFPICRDTNKFHLKTSEENSENIKRLYHTNKLNICTTKYFKHIIGELKVDFNISEIVYKNSDHSYECAETLKLKPEFDKITNVASRTLYCQANISTKTITTIKSSINKGLQIERKHCHTNEDKENLSSPALIEFLEPYATQKEIMNKNYNQFDKPLQKDNFYRTNYLRKSYHFGNQDSNCLKSTFPATCNNKNKDNNKLKPHSITDTNQFSILRKATNNIMEKSFSKDNCKSPQKAKNQENDHLSKFDPENVEFHFKDINVEEESLQVDTLAVHLNNIDNGLSVDGDVIILPPPEFRDDNTYSLKLGNDLNKYEKSRECLENGNIDINVEEETLQVDPLEVHLKNIDNNDLSVDGDVIISPPPEFRDDNTYLLKLGNDLNKSKKPRECLENSNIDNNKTIDEKFSLSNSDLYSGDRTSLKNINSIISKDIPRNPSVKNILQKYRNAFKREKTINFTDYDIKYNKYDNADSQETKSIKINQFRRKYKIRDIDKINIPLPNSLFVETQNSNMSTQQDNLTNEVDYDNHNEFQQNDHSYNNKHIEQDHLTPRFDSVLNTIKNKIQQSYLIHNNKEVLDYSTQIPESVVDIDDDIEEETPEIHSPDNIDRLYSPTEYNINEAILNPKTLLEYYNKNDEVDTLIDPAEFCDNNNCTCSPTCHNNSYLDQRSIDGITQEENLNDAGNFETANVFRNDAVIELTPSKEVETWTLSPEDMKTGPFDSDSCLSYTMMHKKRTETKALDNNSYIFNRSRRAKLSHFKYERKSAFKKI